MKAYGKYKQIITKDRRTLKAHRVLVEKILGRKLDNKVEIHHVDGNRANNNHTNLVVCPDREYHQLLHRRQRAQEGGFPPHYLQCTDCKNFSDTDNFSKNKTRASGYNNLCKICDNIRNKDRYARSCGRRFSKLHKCG